MRTCKMTLRTVLVLTAGLWLSGCLEERTDESAADASAVAPDAASIDGAANDAAVMDTAAPDGGPLAGPPLLAKGASCVASSECTSGNCAMPCEGYGACAPATCSSDADCGSIAGRVHCCTDGTCGAITGAKCGDRAGKQGAICGGMGQSACAEGFNCLAPCMADGICAAACVETKDCAALGAKMACFKTFANGKRCIDDPDQVGLCTLDADCTGGVCGLAQSYNGTKVLKVCKEALGPGAVGHACKATTDCAIGQCLAGFCSKACTKDEQCLCGADPKCSRDQICFDVTFSLSGGASASTKLCYPLSRCDSNADCGNKICMARAQTDGWALVCDKALTAEAKVAGAPCQDSAGCKSNVCHDNKCRDLCTQDSHCDGASCKQVEVTGPVPAGSKVGVCL